jgi:DNA-3-methyladenine glycosylase II
MTEETFRYLAKADPPMGRLIRRIGPSTFKPQRRRSPYEALVRAVTFQQLHGKAAQTILTRFIALFPGQPFPRPESVAAASDDLLRSAGLSRGKTAAIKDIATKTLEGLVPDRRSVSRLSDDEIVERLTQIRGVGPWTVEMLLIFTLGRPNVLPANDLGVRKGFALTYGSKTLPDPGELLEYGRRWEPHRTTAAWYLWRAADS